MPNLQWQRLNAGVSFLICPEFRVQAAWNLVNAELQAPIQDNTAPDSDLTFFRQSLIIAKRLSCEILEAGCETRLLRS